MPNVVKRFLLLVTQAGNKGKRTEALIAPAKRFKMHVQKVCGHVKNSRIPFIIRKNVPVMGKANLNGMCEFFTSPQRFAKEAERALLYFFKKDTAGLPQSRNLIQHLLVENGYIIADIVKIIMKALKYYFGSNQTKKMYTTQLWTSKRVEVIQLAPAALAKRFASTDVKLTMYSTVQPTNCAPSSIFTKP